MEVDEMASWEDPRYQPLRLGYGVYFERLICKSQKPALICVWGIIRPFGAVAYAADLRLQKYVKASISIKASGWQCRKETWVRASDALSSTRRLDVKNQVNLAFDTCFLQCTQRFREDITFSPDYLTIRQLSRSMRITILSICWRCLSAIAIKMTESPKY